MLIPMSFMMAKSIFSNAASLRDRGAPPVTFLPRFLIPALETIHQRYAADPNVREALHHCLRERSWSSALVLASVLESHTDSRIPQLLRPFSQAHVRHGASEDLTDLADGETRQRWLVLLARLERDEIAAWHRSVERSAPPLTGQPVPPLWSGRHSEWRMYLEEDPETAADKEPSGSGNHHGEGQHCRRQRLGHIERRFPSIKAFEEHGDAEALVVAMNQLKDAFGELYQGSAVTGSAATDFWNWRSTVFAKDSW
jgi:hypothetical protein